MRRDRLTPVRRSLPRVVFWLASAALARAQAPAHPDYFTRLGGARTDNAWDVAVDAAGNAYIAGTSDSLTALRSGPDGAPTPDFDAFVIKLLPDGRIAYSRMLGGSAPDQASKIALGSSGNVFIAGYTFSSDFPTTSGAFDRTYNGGSIDAFVAELGPDGSLIYSTFLGGDADDYGGGITVDAAGRAYFTGYTESSDFPTTPSAFDRTINGISDVVVVCLDPNGASQLYSTFVGGRGIDIGYDIAVDGAGSAVLTGQTSSLDFPTTPGAFRPFYGEGRADAFVVRVAPNGGELEYCTYLGGTEFDDAKGLVLDSEGNAYVVGRTESFDFPTTEGAYDRSYNGGRDAFVTKLSADGATLVYATFLGGGGEEEGGGIVLDPSGGAFVTGWTFSDDFPTTAQAFDPSYNGNYDAFLTALDAAGSRLDYGTYLGSLYSDYGRGVGADASGNAYVAGYTGFENVDSFALKLATK